MQTKIVWVTKYTLSSNGRIDVKNLKVSSVDNECLADGWNLLKLGKDCHESLDAAIQAAEAARLKKIASLRKQIEKLEKLTFKEA